MLEGRRADAQQTPALANSTDQMVYVSVQSYRQSPPLSMFVGAPAQSGAPTLENDCKGLT